jgi:hypothetical protein
MATGAAAAAELPRLGRHRMEPAAAPRRSTRAAVALRQWAPPEKPLACLPCRCVKHGGAVEGVVTGWPVVSADLSHIVVGEG